MIENSQLLYSKSQCSHYASHDCPLGHRLYYTVSLLFLLDGGNNACATHVPAVRLTTFH